MTAGSPATPEVVPHPWPTQVLLIDDAVEVHLLLRLRLEVEGFLVVAEAASCAEAIALVQAHHPEAVVLDVALRDGLQALVDPLIQRLRVVTTAPPPAPAAGELSAADAGPRRHHPHR